MFQTIETIWVNANPSFKRFDRRVVNCLSEQKAIALWEYNQHQDEGSSLDIALVLLHDYLKSLSQPVHLIGHGTGGLIALLYARKYPCRVKSLILLGVGVHPAIDWQAHYYALRKLLPCSQEIVLAQMVQRAFGYQNRSNTKSLVEVLKQDLNTSPSPHSLYRQIRIAAGGVEMPLMICGSKNDEITDSNALTGWLTYFKDQDVLWQCPAGHHFFHYFFPHKVSQEVIKFWEGIETVDTTNKALVTVK